MIPFGLAAYEELRMPGRLEPAAFLESWVEWDEQGRGLILGAWRDAQLLGVIGFVCAPDPNDHRLIGHRLFWYVDPPARGSDVAARLLAAYEDTCRAVGCVEMQMSTLSTYRYEAFAQLYHRAGFRPLAVVFRKVLL